MYKMWKYAKVLTVLTIHQSTDPNLQFSEYPEMLTWFVFLTSTSAPHPAPFYPIFIISFLLLFHAYSSLLCHTLVVSSHVSETLCLRLRYIFTDVKTYSHLRVESAPSSIMGGDVRKNVSKWGERGVPAAIRTTSSWSHQVCYCRLCGSPNPAITHMADCNL